MIKRISVLLLLLALSMTALFGCSQTKETKHASAIINTDKTNKEENLTPVTLNEVAHSIFYAPMYVAIEKGYFEEEGINLNLVTGFGADKTMTAVISGTADIGFMGSEASIYAYNEGANDYVVNFAQLTQRAGNFLVAREEIPDFHWTDLKDKKVLGGRKGGMPEMVFEYILRQNGIDPSKDLIIDQSIDFGSTAAAFAEGNADFTVEFEPGGICSCFSRYRQRLCTLYCIFSKEKLYREECRCNSRIYRCIAKRYGLCTETYTKGNCRSNCTSV